MVEPPPWLGRPSSGPSTHPQPWAGWPGALPMWHACVCARAHAHVETVARGSAVTGSSPGRSGLSTARVDVLLSVKGSNFSLNAGRAGLPAGVGRCPRWDWRIGLNQGPRQDRWNPTPGELQVGLSPTAKRSQRPQVGRNNSLHPRVWLFQELGGLRGSGEVPEGSVVDGTAPCTLELGLEGPGGGGQAGRAWSVGSGPGSASSSLSLPLSPHPAPATF